MSRVLLQAWIRTVRLHRNDCAVIEAASGTKTSFGELDALAVQWTSQHGPPGGPSLAGAPVVFAAPNGIRWLEIFLGLVHAGAVAVPLDPGEPAAAQREAAAAMRAAYWLDHDRLVPLSGNRRIRDPEIALVKLTSGTTGKPRALAFTGAQMLADARQLMSTMGFGPRDLNYALIPLGHSYGLGNITIPLILAGVPMACGDSPLPHAIAGDFRRCRPTVFPGVPAMWRALAESELPRSSLASLRLAISAGAALAPEVARAFAKRIGRPLHNFYGSSETGGIAYDRTGRATLAGAVGKPVQGVRIESAANGRIRISSPAVFTHGNRRHWGALGCWIPADRVAIGAGGVLSVLGRRGAIVKIAGRRVNLAEVEARLRRIKDVREVFVTAAQGPESILGAAVATELTSDELRQVMLKDRAPWKVPKRWLVMKSLPLTPRGKTDTRKLRALLFGTAPTGQRPIHL